jgi:glutathione synthase
MPSIALLVAQTDVIVDDNYLRLANELLTRGYAVELGFIDSLAMASSKVVAAVFPLVMPLNAGAPFPPMTARPLADFDTVWILSLGLRNNFLDKFQLLYTLEGQCRLLNSLTAIMHFTSKYFLANHPEVFQHPQLFASADPKALYQHMLDAHQLNPDQRWIAKPPAGSLGRSVFLLHAKDPNTQVILETLTGSDADEYCLLQPYVAQIEQGEKRVLIAGGVPVGQYLRRAQKDHRTNLMQGAHISACELSPTEHAYCLHIGQFLLSHGVELAGMDLAYPWVIEFNVINPGGLHTIQQLTGVDLSATIIDHIFPTNLSSLERHSSMSLLEPINPINNAAGP